MPGRKLKLPSVRKTQLTETCRRRAQSRCWWRFPGMDPKITILFPLCSYLPLTRGEVLQVRNCLRTEALPQIIRGLKQGLTEEERYAVADHAVAQLKIAAILGD